MPPMKKFRKTIKKNWKKKSTKLVKKVPSIENRIVNATRRHWTGTWSFSTASTAGYCPQYTFQLSNVPQYTDFLLFKQFRIKAVSVTFVPKYNVSDLSNTKGIPTIFIRTERPGSYTPGVYNQNNLNVFLNSKTTTLVMDKPRSFYMKVNTISGSGDIEFNRWRGVAQDNTEVYQGFYSWCHVPFQDTTNNAPQFDVFVKYYMQFREIS